MDSLLRPRTTRWQRRLEAEAQPSQQPPPQPLPPAITFPDASTAQGDCSLAPDTGPCRAQLRRWFWSGAVGACQEFTYGGCQGNGNNFETKEACEVACKPGSPLPVSVAPASVATGGGGGVSSGGSSGSGGGGGSASSGQAGGVADRVHNGGLQRTQNVTLLQISAVSQARPSSGISGRGLAAATAAALATAAATVAASALLA